MKGCGSWLCRTMMQSMAAFSSLAERWTPRSPISICIGEASDRGVDVRAWGECSGGGAGSRSERLATGRVHLNRSRTIRPDPTPIPTRRQDGQNAALISLRHHGQMQIGIQKRRSNLAFHRAARSHPFHDTWRLSWTDSNKEKLANCLSYRYSVTGTNPVGDPAYLAGQVDTRR